MNALYNREESSQQFLQILLTNFDNTKANALSENKYFVDMLKLKQLHLRFNVNKQRIR